MIQKGCLPGLFTSSDSSWERLLAATEIFIGYQPFKDEVDPQMVPSLRDQIREKEYFIITSDKRTDPILVAEDLTRTYDQKNVALLIPGQAFDEYGTRHGRGGGWYDRFLSRVPRSWVRIGVTDTVHFSFEPLVRRAWDEPMDWVVVQAGSMWQVKRTSRDAGES